MGQLIEQFRSGWQSMVSQEKLKGLDIIAFPYIIITFRKDALEMSSVSTVTR